MSIRFPKMHIAESVVNRILNLAEFDLKQVYPPAQPQVPTQPPVVPDPVFQGGALDAALQQPPAPVAGVTPEDEAAVGQGLVLDGLGFLPPV